MNILAMDSSSTAASVVYLSDDKILAQSYINAGLTHSTTLMPMTQAVLDNANLKLSDVNYFAVSVGPGSFTGLRIGISAIKGLSLAENKPCVPVSTLEAMAYNYAYSNIIVCAVIDARCNRFFNALFQCESDGTVKRLCEDRVISYEELEAELNDSYYYKNVVLAGDGAELAHRLLRTQKVALHIAPAHLRYQQASGVAMAAKNLVELGKTVTSQQLLPSYLSLPQAQRELQKKLKKDE